MRPYKTDEMNNIEILSKTDRTSWTRIGMVVRYFWPLWRTKGWVFPLGSMVLALMAFRHPGAPDTLQLFTWGILMGIAPIMMAKKPNGELFNSLPALPAEKCVALFGWFYVVIPVLLLVPLQLVQWIMGIPDPAEIDGIPMTLPIQVASALLLYAMSATCLWAVMAARRNRSLRGVAASFGVLFSLYLVFAIVGFVAGFKIAYYNEQLDVEGLMYSEKLWTWIGVCLFVYFLFATWRAARVIGHKQV